MRMSMSRSFLIRFGKRYAFSVTSMIGTPLSITFLVAYLSLTSFAQSPEFSEPWNNPNIALAIDPYEGNDIDWDKLATDKRVVAIIHRAFIARRLAFVPTANMPNAVSKRS